MKNKILELLIAILILAIPFAYASFIYQSLPASIPTHFNINGEADSWGDRSSVFLGPGILGLVGIFTYFIFTNIKNLDPKRVKAEDDGMFKKLAFATLVFFSLLGMIITYSATGNSLNITKLLLPFIGIVLSVFGWYMPKLHQNYFAGFRMPWTLENVDNWNATHKMAGKIWQWGGLLQAILIVLVPPKLGLAFFLIITGVMVVIPIGFSYRMFKKGNQIN